MMNKLIKKLLNKKVAAKINKISKYADCLWQWKPLSKDRLELLNLIQCLQKNILTNDPDDNFPPHKNAIFLINGNFNTGTDIQEELGRIYKLLNRHSRVLVVSYPSSHWFLTRLFLPQRYREKKDLTVVNPSDMKNLAQLANFKLIDIKQVSLFRYIPFLQYLFNIKIYILRPVIRETSYPPLSIIVPARNEKGNIENIIKSIPEIPNVQTEIIFIEGYSTDGTWDEIERIRQKYARQYNIKTFKQKGHGKKDAVQDGFDQASYDLLTIIDADLTVDPKHLTKFYQAYVNGHGDFITGNRLFYPMEKQAMRFLNRLGNEFFAKTLSHVLSRHIDDALCGTKLLSRADWHRFKAWNKDFGDFDPFGDFNLLFPAAQMGLDIVNIPVPYKARQYGQTNIHRFKDGVKLLHMTLHGFHQLR